MGTQCLGGSYGARHALRREQDDVIAIYWQGALDASGSGLTCQSRDE